MRTNIEIDDSLMGEAMKAGPFKTKKEAVEAGLRLLARQAAYREIVKWRGKLRWEGDEGSDWTVSSAETARSLSFAEPAAAYSPGGQSARPLAGRSTPARQAGPTRPAKPAGKDRAGR